MDIVEHEAKRLMRDAGLPVPHGAVLGPDDPVRADGPVVVKAQVPFGGRGKRGLVLPAEAADAADVVATVRARMRALGFAEPFVLVEPRLPATSECYLAWSIDDVAQAHVLSFSRHGGVDVESAAEAPARIAFAPGHVPLAHDLVPFFAAAGVAGRTLAALCRFAVAAHRVYVQADATLLEVNPLAVTPRGDVVALDAKLSIDDNALGRHGEWARSHSVRLAALQSTDLERRAAADGFTYVELGGRIAVLSGGAGLGMALVDVLADAGRPAANFVDSSGGSGSAIIDRLGGLVLERAARDDVDAILMFYTLSATSLAGVVRGLLALFDRVPPPKPMVVGLLCAGAAEREMRFDEARALFEARGWRCERDLPGVVGALRALTGDVPPAPRTETR